MNVQQALKSARRRVAFGVRDALARPAPDPIIVFGHQKAGTTAIAALLAQATGRSFSNDMMFRRKWRDSDRILGGAATVRELMARAPAEFACGVIKDPDLTFLAPRIAEELPDARLLAIVRDPRRNIKSILDRLRIPGDCEDYDALGDPTLLSLPLWRILFDPRLLGLEGGTYVEVLAQRWLRAVERIEAVGERCHLVRYEDFLADKRGVVEALAAAAGIPVVADVSAALDRQYQPPGDRSKTMEAFFGPDNLARIERICAPRLAHYGYS